MSMKFWNAAKRTTQMAFIRHLIIYTNSLSLCVSLLKLNIRTNYHIMNSEADILSVCAATDDVFYTTKCTYTYMID